MDDRGDEIDRAIDRLRARLLAGLDLDRLGPVLAWVVTQPDDELEDLGLPLSEDDRLEMIAWVLELARRRP
jgi:hypothetical protein